MSSRPFRGTRNHVIIDFTYIILIIKGRINTRGALHIHLERPVSQTFHKRRRLQLCLAGALPDPDRAIRRASTVTAHGGVSSQMSVARRVCGIDLSQGSQRTEKNPYKG